MFNTFQFNEAQFNEIFSWIVTADQDDVVYGWYSLKNESITLSAIGYENWHSTESETYNNPISDLWGELNYYFREKTLVLRGRLKASNREELEHKIDEMKRALGRNNRDLDIKVNGTIRRAKATCVNLPSLFNREHYHITFIPFTIQFRIISEFSKELARQSQSFNNLTADITEEIVNRGTVRTNPTLQILFTSTTCTELSFTLWNNTIEVPYTFSASDVLVIDCEEKEVRVNNTEIDFNGTFPILRVWTNSYTVTLNGTNDYNLNFSYFNNFL